MMLISICEQPRQLWFCYLRWLFTAVDAGESSGTGFFLYDRGPLVREIAVERY